MRLASPLLLEGDVPSALAPRVHISWRSLDVDDESCARFAALLSSDEQRHAERFRFAIDRRRYAVRRGVLRDLLARRLACDPRDVAIRHNAFGKPYVEGSDVTFNVSHSQGMALYAFARGPELGCDVEWQDSRVPIGETAEMVLSPMEIDTLRSLPETQRTRAFFNYWTAKEAYLKARGVGFSLPPHEIAVSLDGSPCFVALPDDDPSDWSLTYLDLAPCYVGALVVRGPAPMIAR